MPNKVIIFLVIVVGLGLVGGCGGKPELDQNYKQFVDAIKAFKQMPTLRIKGVPGKPMILKNVELIESYAPINPGSFIQQRRPDQPHPIWAFLLKGLGLVNTGINTAGSMFAPYLLANAVGSNMVDMAGTLAGNMGSNFNYVQTVSGNGAGGVIGDGISSPATSTPTVVYQPEPLVLLSPNR